MTHFSRWQAGSAALAALGTLAGAAAPLIVSMPATAQTNFTDVSFGFWARPFIQRLAQENIIAGFPDGTFRPNQPVTRAQFAAIVRQAFSQAEIRSSRNFPDVPSNYWAQGAIQEAYRTGFLTGYPNGAFQPNQEIPKVQVLVSLTNGLNLRPTGSITETLNRYYQDTNEIPSYAVDEVAAATQRNIVVSYPDVNFLAPQEVATRADVAAYIYQTLVNQGKLPRLASNVDATKYIIGYSTSGTGTGTGTTTPNTTTSTGLRVAQDTPIDVESPNPGNIVIAPGQTYVTTLRVAADVRNSQGQILIPRGSLIQGQLEPVAVSGSPVNGARFVANQLTIGNTTYSINAVSAPIAATVAQQVSNQTLQGAAVTAAAQAILGGQVSDLGSIIGQALGGVTGTPTSQNYVISVNPSTQLDLRVQEAFNVRSST